MGSVSREERSREQAWPRWKRKRELCERAGLKVGSALGREVQTGLVGTNTVYLALWVRQFHFNPVHSFGLEKLSVCSTWLPLLIHVTLRTLIHLLLFSLTCVSAGLCKTIGQLECDGQDPSPGQRISSCPPGPGQQHCASMPQALRAVPTLRQQPAMHITLQE